MNPSEAWALLTLRSKGNERIPGGFTRLTPVDAAAMLGGLERDAFLMGMAAECGDMGALQDLERRLWVQVQGMAQRERWKASEYRGEMICRRLAGLALYETIDDRRCATCNGKGTTTFELRREPDLILSPHYERLNAYEGRIRCRSCIGSGVVKLSGRKRADLAGINKDTWTRIWARRYEPVFTLTTTWLAEARRHLASRLREHKEDEAEAA